MCIPAGRFRVDPAIKFRLAVGDRSRGVFSMQVGDTEVAVVISCFLIYGGMQQLPVLSGL